MTAVPSVSATPAASVAAPSTRVAKAAQRWADLDRLRRNSAMYDAVIDEIDGRMIRIGDQWLADFASCNYLGFDLDREIIDADPGATCDAWGTHPSWSRLLGQPGALRARSRSSSPSCSAPRTPSSLPTITHIHMSVIPLLAACGHDLPRRPGAQDDLRRLPGRPRPRRRRSSRFRFEDPEHLDELLSRRARPGPRLVVHGRRQQHDRQRPGPARRSPRSAASTTRCSTSTTRTASASSASEPDRRRTRYGMRGNSIVAPLRRELRQRHPRRRLLQGLLVAAGVHRAARPRSRTCSRSRRRRTCTPARRPSPRWPPCWPARRQRRPAATRSGPTCSARTDRVLDAPSRELGIQTPNRSGFPIIEIPLRRPRATSTRSGDFLFERGVYVTLAAYPLVPKTEVGFRVQLTAANTDAEVDTSARAARGRRPFRAGTRVTARLGRGARPGDARRGSGSLGPLRDRDFRLLWTGHDRVAARRRRAAGRAGVAGLRARRTGRRRWPGWEWR